MGVSSVNEAVPAEGAQEVGSYDIWRAQKDLERLAFGYRSRSAELPPELLRLQDFLQRLSAVHC